MVKTTICKIVTLLLAAIILLTMFAGCNTEKTPEEEFSLIKEEVSVIDTQNFYTFKEFVKNVVLEEEKIDVEDLFIKIGDDSTITVHVLSTDKAYTVYTVESSQIWGIAQAITSEKNFIYLQSHNDEGEEIFIQRPFDEFIWNAWYEVEGDRIIFEP